MAEASLEGILTSTSAIAMTSRSGSITPPADAMELQENANKALEELLTTKASINAHRWIAVWELGVELHQNESKATESIKEAKAICSHATLDAQALCFATVKKAKAACIAVVKEAKTTWVHSIWEVKAACSTAIRDVKVQRASQAELLQMEHSNILQGLETQAIWKDSRSQANFLSTSQATLYASPVELKCSGGFLPPLIETDASISPICPITKGFSSGGTACLSCSSCTSAQAVSQVQRTTPFPRSSGEHAYGWNHIEGNFGRTPQLQAVRDPALEQDTQAEPGRGGLAGTLTW